MSAVRSGKPEILPSAGDALPWRGRALGPYPLTLAVEAMAQAALALLGNLGNAGPDGGGERSAHLAGVNEARLLAPIEGPIESGDRLTAYADLAGRFGPMVKVECHLDRDEERVAEAELLLALT